MVIQEFNQVEGVRLFLDPREAEDTARKMREGRDCAVITVWPCDLENPFQEER